MKEPPDQTAVFSAENLLSPPGMTEPEDPEDFLCALAQAGVGVEEDDALRLGSSGKSGTTSDSLLRGRYAGHQTLLLGLGDA